MIVLKTTKDIDYWIGEVKKNGGSIGLVPTMGALHAGHLALIGKSRELCTHTVTSIFVNPTQFNNPEDFEKYPVTLERDIFELEKSGADVLFLPSLETVYPSGIRPSKHYDLGNLETKLEGKFRPGHFQGVCQVVEKFLNIVKPDCLFLGQKDYQQCLVLKKLISMLSYPVKAVLCPTFREPDGLAMSSRNLRLNNSQRHLAAEVYKSLQYIRTNFNYLPSSILKSNVRLELEKKGFRVDYVDIADLKNLDTIPDGQSKINTIALIAVFIDDIRLIDNILLTGEKGNEIDISASL